MSTHKHPCGHCDGLGHYCLIHDRPCAETGCDAADLDIEDEDDAECGTCEVEECEHCLGGQVDWTFVAEETGSCHECMAGKREDEDDVPLMPVGDFTWVCEKCLRKWHDSWHPNCTEGDVKNGE